VSKGKPKRGEQRVADFPAEASDLMQKSHFKGGLKEWEGALK